MSREDPTRAEEAAATALARALEGDGGGPDLPDDALEAAALLRYSQDGGVLPAERRRAILEALLSEVPAAVPATARKVAWRRWLWPVAGLVGAAALAALLVLRGGAAGPELGPTALPPPSAELLRAQVAAAQAGHGSDEALAAGMRTYRRDMYAALAAHYAVGRP